MISADDVIIYVVCHDDASKAQADDLVATHYPYGKVVRIPQTPYFESAIFDHMIKNTHEWIEKKWVGIITYNFNKKLKGPTDILEAIRENESADIIPFFNLTFVRQKTNTVFNAIDAVGLQHGSYLILIIYKLLMRQGYREDQIIDKRTPSFFCNFWVAKNIWMQRYLRFFATCKKIIETDPLLSSYINEEAIYDNGNLTKERLMQICGKPYYTFHPFVFERLPCHFFHMNGAKFGKGGRQGLYYLK